MGEAKRKEVAWVDAARAQMRDLHTKLVGWIEKVRAEAIDDLSDEARTSGYRARAAGLVLGYLDPSLPIDQQPSQQPMSSPHKLSSAGSDQSLGAGGAQASTTAGPVTEGNGDPPTTPTKVPTEDIKQAASAVAPAIGCAVANKPASAISDSSTSGRQARALQKFLSSGVPEGIPPPSKSYKSLITLAEFSLYIAKIGEAKSPVEKRTEVKNLGVFKKAVSDLLVQVKHAEKMLGESVGGVHKRLQEEHAAVGRRAVQRARGIQNDAILRAS